jgi:hypothetical protein
MQCIEEFLKEDKAPDWASSLKNYDSPCDEADDIRFEYAIFEWNIHPVKKKNDVFQLGLLNVEVQERWLCFCHSWEVQLPSFVLADNNQRFMEEMNYTSSRPMLNKMGHQVGYCGQNLCMFECLSVWLQCISSPSSRAGTCHYL